MACGVVGSTMTTKPKERDRSVKKPCVGCAHPTARQDTQNTTTATQKHDAKTPKHTNGKASKTERVWLLTMAHFTQYTTPRRPQDTNNGKNLKDSTAEL